MSSNERELGREIYRRARGRDGCVPAAARDARVGGTMSNARERTPVLSLSERRARMVTAVSGIVGAVGLVATAGSQIAHAAWHVSAATAHDATRVGAVIAIPAVALFFVTSGIVSDSTDRHREAPARRDDE